MNPQTPKWIRDLHSYIESVPYGEVDIQIKRVDHKTVTISTVAEETLRYVDNSEAIRDLDRMVLELINTGFSGQAHVKLEMKDGQIKLLGIFDKKQTTY